MSLGLLLRQIAASLFGHVESCNQGTLSETEISESSIRLRAWISKYTLKTGGM